MCVGNTCCSSTCSCSECSGRAVAEHSSTGGSRWSPGALQKDGEVLPAHCRLVQEVPWKPLILNVGMCHLLGVEVHSRGRKNQASNVTFLVSVFKYLPCFSQKVELFFCDCSFKNANKTFLLICVYWQNYCNCIK